MKKLLNPKESKKVAGGYTCDPKVLNAIDEKYNAELQSAIKSGDARRVQEVFDKIENEKRNVMYGF